MRSRVKTIGNSYEERFSLVPVIWGLGVGLAWSVAELAVSAFSLGYLAKVFVIPVLVADGFAGLVFGFALCVARSIAGVQGRALVGAALIWFPALLYTTLKVQAELLPTLAWWHLQSLLNLIVLGALGVWGAHRCFVRLFEPKVRVDLATLVVGSATLAITLIWVTLFVHVQGRLAHPLWAWLTVLALPVLLDRASRDLTRALSQLSGVQQSRGRYALAALFAFLVLSGWEYFDQRGRLPQHSHLVGQPVSGSSTGPDNLILIVLSGVRADHLTAYGYGVGASPVLASLARAADRYERCYSTSADCRLARTSLMTALPPSLQGNRVPEPASSALPGLGSPPAVRRGVPLAEVLHWQGYRTIAVVADADGSSGALDLAQGFEVYDGQSRLRLAGAETPLLFKVQARLCRWIESWLDGPALWFRGEYLQHFQPHRTVTEVLQAVAARLGTLQRRPLFLFVLLMDAREPYVPPVEFLPLGEGIQLDLWGGLPAEEVQQINCGERPLTEGESRTLRALYDAEIQYLDHGLGRLLESLENTGLLPRSLVVITGDCGVLLGEEGRLGSGVDLLPAALHVPLIVKRPGQKRGEREAEPLSLSHVKSLVLRELGLAHTFGAGEYVFGLSLDQPVVAEWSPSPSLLEACRSQWPDSLGAILRGQRMLVTDLEQERRLYDLSVPGQSALQSIEGASAEVLYLEGYLKTWKASLPF